MNIWDYFLQLENWSVLGLLIAFVFTLGYVSLGHPTLKQALKMGFRRPADLSGARFANQQFIRFWPPQRRYVPAHYDAHGSPRFLFW